VVADEVSLDSLLRGKIRVYQPRRGARVTLDPLFLADFVAGSRARRVLDLGCGTGVIGLALAMRDARARVVGVELHPAMAELARRNVELNGLGERMEIVEADLRRLKLDATFDLVVSNPPYHDDGRPAARADRTLARHQVECTLADVAAAAKRLALPRGRVAVVYPADGLGELVAALTEAGFAWRRLRAIHSVAEELARRVLVEAVRGYKGGLEILPPLVVHGADRKTFTDEARQILE
jgi:tRNA1(Val) A37 N6-methylase TrmN6